MLGGHAAMSSNEPRLEIGKDAVNVCQLLCRVRLRRPVLNDVPITPPWRVLIRLQSVGNNRSPFLDVAFKESLNTFLAGAFDLPKSHPARKFSVNFNRCNDHRLRSSTSALSCCFPGVTGADKSFVHLNRSV